MGLMDMLFENKTIQDKVFGTVKNTMKEQGMKYIILELKEDGELSLQWLQEQNKPVVFSQDTVDEMAESWQGYQNEVVILKKQLDQYKSLVIDEQDLTKLVQICEEQEGTIVQQREEAERLIGQIEHYKRLMEINNIPPFCKGDNPGADFEPENFNDNDSNGDTGEREDI